MKFLLEEKETIHSMDSIQLLFLITTAGQESSKIKLVLLIDKTFLFFVAVIFCWQKFI